MKRKKIFRDVSLERLSSPEQLDQLMQVVAPRGWVALSGMGIAILSVVFWGLAGNVPTKIAGHGVLIKTGGISEITAPGGGRLSDIAVRSDDIVASGQTVARISRPDLEEELRMARLQLEELQQKHVQVKAFKEKDVRLRLEHLGQRRKNSEQAIASVKEQIAWLEEKARSRAQLLESGLITRQQLIDTEEKLRAARQQLKEERARLQEIQIERETFLNAQEQRTLDDQFAVEEQQRRVAHLAEELRRKTRVVAEQSGRVLEVTVERGDLVREGQSILSYSRRGRDVQDLEAVLYVAAQDGKKIEAGMEIQIAPATVESEDYGRMIGTVTYVSDYPATKVGMMQLLENEQLVETLTAGGAPYELQADLTLDPATPSGYRWTSSSGPPVEIRSGTLCRGTVTVDRRRPVELVLPIFKASN